ncbi:MAG: hypothetical protein HRT87_01580 [Legionellales bacterium]|nr:hypothetical protein [Legionellales bacterium]
MSRLYNNPEFMSKEEFAQTLKNKSVDSDFLCSAIVSSVNSIQDYKWLLSEYKKLLLHDSIDVQAVTISCIGHLARIHRGDINKETLIKILRPLLNSPTLSPKINDAIDDIDMFCS